MKTFGCPRAGLGPPVQATILVSTIIGGTSAIRSMAHLVLVCFTLPSRSINLRFLVSSSDHVWPVWVTSSAKIFKIQKHFIRNLLKMCITFCLVKLAFVKFLCIPSLNEMMQPSMILNTLIPNNISKLRSSEVTSDTIWQIWMPWLMLKLNQNVEMKQNFLLFWTFSRFKANWVWYQI